MKEVGRLLGGWLHLQKAQTAALASEWIRWSQDIGEPICPTDQTQSYAKAPH
jgi:hypothetical protein